MGGGKQEDKHSRFQLSISQLYAEQCAAEPIHLLGTVQSHGYVVVVSLADETICQVSAGVVRHCAAVDRPEDMLGRPAREWLKPIGQSLGDLIAELNEDSVTTVNIARRLAADEAGPVAWDNGENVDCTAYRSGDYAVFELVPYDALSEEMVGQLRSLGAFSRAVSSDAEAADTEGFLRGCAEKLQQVSGYHRVMVYRFLPDWSGEVLAEATAASTSERFLGLRFPASDIPPQARELYLRNRVRVLADVAAPPDPLVPERLPDGQVLDQSMGMLRAMSNAHLVYLTNMGVRATLTISIVVDGRLWGMIACHHNEPLIPPRALVQTMCSSIDLLAHIIAARVKVMVDHDLAARSTRLRQSLDRFARLLVIDERTLDASVKSDAAELAEVVGASHVGVLVGAALAVSFNCAPDQLQLIKRKLEDLVSQDGEWSVRSWNRLPDSLAGCPGLPERCRGIMIARFHGQDGGLIFWLRDELVQEVRWAGQPEKFVIVDQGGEVKLEPRRSFLKWKETVYSRCEDWVADDEVLADLAAQRVGETLAAVSAQRLRRRLDWTSSHDELTGLPNRRWLIAELADRLGRGAVSVLIIDIDNFKHVNDTLGHEVGDSILVETGSRLASMAAEHCAVGRLSGDEFMLFCPLDADRSQEEQLAPVLAAIRENLRMPIQFGGDSFQLDCSIGVACSPEHGSESTALFRRADIALFEAKRLGRGRAVVYAAELEATLLRQVDVERELETAIATGQLRLYYQPQVDLAARRVIGCESLVRWQHPERGLLSPAAFLSVAEQGPLIHRLGHWVIGEAVRQLAIWNRDLAMDFRVAVNVSFAQIREGDLLNQVAEHLERYGSNPSNLEVELTESSVLGDEETSRRVVDDIRAMGIKVALDDFGTGYSSLAHLHRIDFDYIKIDRSFVMQVDVDQQSQGLVRSLLSLAEVLGVQAIAEGVEQDAHAHWLQSAGCTLAQGYLWSPAVPAGEFPAVVRRIEAELRR